MADSRKHNSDYSITNRTLRKQDFHHFRHMIDGSAALRDRILAERAHA